MPTVLVTGATGLVARPIVPLLVKKGLSVRALVRNPALAKDLSDQGVEVVAGSFDRADALQRAFSGVDRLLLITPSHQDSVLWTYKILEAARFSRKVHIVRLSAFKASATAPSEEVRMHAQAEQYVAASGAPFTFVRPHFYMQNVLHWWKGIANDGAFGHGAGDGKIAMVDTRDVGDALANVVANPTPHAGRTYTLTGPASISFHDVARILTSVLSRAVKYVPVNPTDLWRTLLSVGANEWTAKVIGEQSSAYAAGWGDLVTDDVVKLAGHPPRSFAQFAAEVFGPTVIPLLPPPPKPVPSLPSFMLKK